MKKTLYTTPSTTVILLTSKAGILQAVSANSTNSFTNAVAGEENEKADVKSHGNAVQWDDWGK